MSREDMTNPSTVRAACLFGLRGGMNHARPEVRVDEKRYVERPEDNLLGGLALEVFEADLNAVAGQELAGKFLAVHSSSALAVNCFAPLKAAEVPFSIGDHSGLLVDGFERRFPTGLPRAQPHHLDVVASGPDQLAAIESKCVEYLSRKQPLFSDRYESGIADERAAGPWYAEMMRLRSGSGATYQWLDAAQLIKHAFGLALGQPARPTTLVYLYWEPMDAGLSPLFEEHRAEIAGFAERVAGGSPRFEAMSYPELWNAWDETGDPFLARHVAALRARYEVPAWAWEGVEWRDGRLRSASWLDELLDNPEAERAVAEDTIERVMQKYGWSEEKARKLFGEPE
jgi:hypothetical protein